MILGITGSRSVTDFDFLPYFHLLDNEFKTFCSNHYTGSLAVTCVITGGAVGVDTTAYDTAQRYGIENLRILPDRSKYPGIQIFKALEKRNEEIVEKCDILLAVWDGSSHGTRNTIKIAEKLGKPCFTVYCPDRCRKSSSTHKARSQQKRQDTAVLP